MADIVDHCEYCGQEDRYGHNAICVINTVNEQRAEIASLRADNERLHIAERGAFEFAFWSWAGPTNDAEFKECERQCAEAWSEYSNAVPRPQITNGERS